MWTAVSIFIPVCFGLIGVSYASVEMLELKWLQLLPLAFASVLLYGFGMSFVSRYSGYNKAILNRLGKIEEENGMNLHRQISKEDKKRGIKWTLRHVKWILFVFLILTWTIRLWLAPLA